jgi:hypothetical protein
MVRPEVADEGGCLQMRRVTADILKKQWLGFEKGLSSSLRIGKGLTNSMAKREREREREREHFTKYPSGIRSLAGSLKPR